MNTTEWIWCNSSPKPDEYGEFVDHFTYHAGNVFLRISSDSNYAAYINGSMQIFPMIKFMMKSTLHLFANPTKTVLPSLCGIMVLIQHRYIIPETPGFFMKSSIKKIFYAEVTLKHCPE